jgi:N4-gp56 family major capsid protein
MANETTTSTLDDLISPLVAEAMFVASETSIMRGLVRNFTMPMRSGKILQVPKYPLVTATAPGENTNLSNTEVSTSKSDLTVAENGVMTTLTDLSRDVSESDVIQDLGRLFGEAISKKMDRDLTALFSGFSQSVGTDGTDLTIATLSQAATKLKAAGVPGPYFGVFNPEQTHALKSTLTNTFADPNAGILQNEAMREGFIGRIVGIDIFETSNVVEDSATAASGGVFARDALGLAMMRDINIETQRDASLRATEIVATAVYATGELHDSYGIEVKSSNSGL